MPQENMNLWASLKFRESLQEAFQGTEDSFSAFASWASRSLAHASEISGQAGASPVPAIKMLAKAGIQGALDLGIDPGSAARGILVGVLRATRDTGESALSTISLTARTVAQTAIENGGDVAAVVRGLVQGAVLCARDIGVEPVPAGSAAGQAAFEAAIELGSSASEKVEEALQGAIGGVKVVPKMPFAQKTKS
jgi:hypothetical protein